MFRKGAFHLLQAWNELRPEGAELLISGNPLGQRAAGDDVPAEIPNCTVLGRVPDSRYLQLLQDADILVHPSLAEGGCNVVYESLACGLPCIVSSNATSAVRTGKEGIVFPVGSITALKGAIQLLCQEPELRRQMGVAARERAESLRWDRYLVSLGAIYERLYEYSHNRSQEALQDIVAAGF
jgi:glycosyltransferase involved in cell wall biosynthesis